MALACLALAATALAACGGGGESDFAAEANAVCRDSAREGAAIYTSSAGAMRTRDDALAAQKRYVALDESSDRRLAGLEAPADGKRPFASYRKDLAEEANLDRKALEAVEANRKSQFGTLLGEASETGEKARKEAAGVPGLAACARKMPAKGAKEVEEAIESNETSADPAQCTEFFTMNAVKLQWKTVEACRKFQEEEDPAQLPKSVDVEVTEGVEKTMATAMVTDHGGPNDGKTAEVGLAFQDGHWKLAFAELKES